MLIRVLLLFSLLHFTSASFGQQKDSTLVQADSLFATGKYTQSFSYYQEILEERKQYSPAMLLKMAYIKEGLSQYDEALYFLNLYYLRTADKEVLSKMDQLADAHNLRGYSINDSDVISSFFYRYYPWIIGILAALAILLLASVYREKMIKKQPATIPAATMVIVLGLLFYILNFGLSYDKAIVTGSTTYLMQGPSAGAEVITVIGSGHRLDIDGKKDVWIKTSWDNRDVYVKASKLRRVQF